MVFVKGQSGNPNGRPPGTQSPAKKAIANYIDRSAEKLDAWLDEIYADKGALEAFKCFADLLEYHVPKLSRTELQNLDKDGEPADNKLIIEFVDAPTNT